VKAFFFEAGKHMHVRDFCHGKGGRSEILLPRDSEAALSASCHD